MTISNRLRYLFLIVAITLAIPFFSQAATPIKKICFLGDSLTDNGNLYKRLLHIIPESPPYYAGRFSNGQTWAEYVQHHFNAQKCYNMAIAGATAYLHSPTQKRLPFTIRQQLTKFYLKTPFSSLFRRKQDTLFTIWIGANDYLGKVKNKEKMLRKTIAAIERTIKSLKKRNARNILIMNLPDLSKTPSATERDEDETLAEMQQRKKDLYYLSMEHNRRLASLVEEMRSSKLNIKLFDICGFMNQALDDIYAFNKRYNTNITDITKPFWEGGYRDRDDDDTRTFALSNEQIKNDIERDIIKNKKSYALKSGEMADLIAQSRSLRTAYALGKNAKEMPEKTKNQDEFFFWDEVHPTRVVHKIFGQVIIDFIENNFPIN